MSVGYSLCVPSVREMSKKTSSILLRFFQGHSLESEFGFVNYYHSHPVNRLLHTLAIPFLVFGLLTLTSSIDYRFSFVFSIFYCSVIFLFDVRAAYAFIILFGVLFGPSVIFATQGLRSIFYGIGIFFTGLLMQGFGHYQFEASPPAFRAFEAIFTTPVFLMMYLISDHRKSFWKRVKEETAKWKENLRKS